MTPIGIFTTDGKQWSDSRQLIRPQFIKDRVSDLEIFERHIEILLSKLGGRGEEVDVKNLFFRSACIFFSNPISN